MKTLINKANPAIRITAPEIDIHEEEQMYLIPVSDYCIPMYIDDWTLIEEEPEKIREIRACIGYALACIPNEKIKDFGVSLQDCLNYIAPVDKGLREPEKQTSKYLKEPDYDKQVVEKMSKELAKIITDQIVEPVDLEKEAVAFCFDNGINATPYQATRFARHFYELGRKAKKEPHWKPSEEQMHYLHKVVIEAKQKEDISATGYTPARVLESLYDQLKKL